MPLPDSAASGDRLATLRDLRDLLATQITSVESGRDLAALSRQLTDVLAQIADLSPEQKKAGDSIDEIAERRAARRSGAASGSSRAGKSR